MSRKPNILFVCAKNKWRSPTAEKIYRNDPRCNVRSAGVSNSAKRTLAETDLQWADLILAMETKHKKRIQSNYSHLHLPEIMVLDIPDDYEYMNPELIFLLQESIEEILDTTEEQLC